MATPTSEIKNELFVITQKIFEETNKLTNLLSRYESLIDAVGGCPLEQMGISQKVKVACALIELPSEKEKG